ncbi:MAG: PspC domain-containing protein [Prevotellaceae bacterium]|jgi:phage shock protein PspC (stress-responsive transcriptional regulator)|nr:PspC domain-containing protein [Prevotellaceae bacterium]
MKKTLTVNLGGTAFHIDEDAYQLLDEYLCNLKLHFQRQQGAEEIMDDIEGRIAELFTEALRDKRKEVIAIQDVTLVIAQIGKPEQFAKPDDEEETSEYEEKNRAHANARATNGNGTRRLYRNPDDKILGGVCSGLSASFDWDPTLLRLLFIFIAFFSVGTMVLIYLLLWIVMPPAQTAAEKLAMRGESVTVENIGRTVTEGFQEVGKRVNTFVHSEQTRTAWQRFFDGLVAIIGALIKVFMFILAIVFCPVLFVLALLLMLFIITAVALVFGGGAVLVGFLTSTIGLADWYPEAPVIISVAAGISGLLMICIPIISLIYLGFQLVFDWKPVNAGWKWGWFAVWLIATVLFILFVIGGFPIDYIDF